MEPRSLNEIELPSLVRVRGAWFYLLASHGELILDYAAYDPSYDPGEWEKTFRGDLLTVLPSDGFRFLSALETAVFAVETIPGFVELNEARARPVVVINFDAGRFVSSFYDQALETLCGRPWNAELGDPLVEVPELISDMFETG